MTRKPKRDTSTTFISPSPIDDVVYRLRATSRLNIEIHVDHQPGDETGTFAITVQKKAALSRRAPVQATFSGRIVSDEANTVLSISDTHAPALYARAPLMALGMLAVFGYFIYLAFEGQAGFVVSSQSLMLVAGLTVAAMAMTFGTFWVTSADLNKLRARAEDMLLRALTA